MSDQPLPEGMQTVALDDDERRVLDAFRRARRNDFADVTLKIHRGKLSAMYVTDKWNFENGKLREVKEAGE